MHIHVLGVGSIGSLVALHLRHSTPHQITLLVKRSSFAQTFRRDLEQTITIEREGSTIRADGFTVELTDPAAETMRNLLRRPDGTLRASILRPRKRYAGVQPSNDPTTPITSLIVTTKAPSTSRAIRALASRLSPDSTITLLQNGMGVYEELCASIFPSPEARPHFVLASTTHGVWAKRPFHTVHAGFGDLVFGVAPSSRVQLPISFEKPSRTQLKDLDLGSHKKNQETLLEQLAPYTSLHGTLNALLSLRGLQPSWIGVSSLQERLQRKLVTNSVVNPLTALMGCRNGSLVGNQYAFKIGREVCREAEKVFRAQTLEDENGPPAKDSSFTDQDLANVNLPLQLTVSSLEAEFVRVARLTSVNFSSMLQDIRGGRETEINYMNGYLSRMGRKYGIQTPVNDMLRTLVKMKGVMPSGDES
ncbi:2-dehydropantoate 2-reductase [Rhizoctonia solani AG-1 IB]|uniref:2-dehydropantoate 2-reductase n=1 Tax=Thanatephorus cucumeris (strain AG1-IB / isolate 7/3/14) TaxID=1108050 RepID=M5BMT9_THACB|nr:2-dehydropantoate 2-reductase [Rhizoctonia solani AG-1 IB]